MKFVLISIGAVGSGMRERLLVTCHSLMIWGNAPFDIGKESSSHRKPPEINLKVTQYDLIELRRIERRSIAELKSVDPAPNQVANLIEERDRSSQVSPPRKIVATRASARTHSTYRLGHF